MSGDGRSLEPLLLSRPSSLAPTGGSPAGFRVLAAETGRRGGRPRLGGATARRGNIRRFGVTSLVSSGPPVVQLVVLRFGE